MTAHGNGAEEESTKNLKTILTRSEGSSDSRSSMHFTIERIGKSSRTGVSGATEKKGKTKRGSQRNGQGIGVTDLISWRGLNARICVSTTVCG